MFSETLTRYHTNFPGHQYICWHFGTGARKRAYTQYKELKQWWKDSVDTTNEQGEVRIYGHTNVTPADYSVSVTLSEDSHIVLFKLKFAPVDDLSLPFRGAA